MFGTVTLPPTFDAPLDGRFVVKDRVGEGSAAVVYRAFDLQEKRPVALKIFRVDESTREGEPSPALELCLQEYALLRQLRHPSVVEIVDAGLLKDLNRPYLALEWIDGGELSRHHQSSPLGIRELLAVGILLSRGLSKLHDAGITHGDIKPSNILMRRRAPGDALVVELEVEPVLIDFGIATQGIGKAFAGTPAYMSPEQARGEKDINHLTDLYSLGATMFDLLIGRPPHQGATPLATLARLATAPAPRLSSFRADIHPLLDEAIDRLLQTDRQARPQSASEVELLFSACLHESVPDSWPHAEASSRIGTRTTRLVTTLVAMNTGSEAERDLALTEIRELGAGAAPLGKDALVAHWGVTRATGGEASAALELAQVLAKAGASVGIASGRARLEGGRSGTFRPVGEVVDRAATLSREAARFEILTDATTSELGRGRFELRMRGDGSAIVGESVARPLGEQSGGAPFVGRDAETAQIVSAFEHATSDQRSMIISISGPPGIGKSRLQRECVARLTTKAEPPRIIVQRSDAYDSRHILGAAADILRSLVDLPRGSEIRDVRRAIEERLGPETMSELTRENQQLLTELLGSKGQAAELDPSASRDALWLAMTDLITRVLSNETIVLVLEDLQWADNESIAWIDHLLGRSSRHPLFVLSCVRPSFWESAEGRFRTRQHLRINLRPISSQAVRIIAETMLGARCTEEQLDGISNQAGGSPLFAEELARLAVAGKSAQKAPTIESAIQASLDALDANSRTALECLSVLGMTCWDTTLAHFGFLDTEAIMHSLVTQDLLVQRNTSRFSDAEEYNFKHALVRDVAYSSLESEHREKLHSQAGKWLADLGEDAATVAGHLDLGGDPENASSYWERAAQRALSANALTDALSMAERALDFATPGEEAFRRASVLDEIYNRLDPRAADRETAISAMESSAFDDTSRVRALGSRARFDEARGTGNDIQERLTEVLHRAEELEMFDEVARCSACLAFRAAYAGDFSTAEREAKRLLGLSLHRVQGSRVDAYQTLAIIRQAKGAVSASLDARKNAAVAAREAGLREREAMLTTNLGFALSTIGARKEAREALERGLLLAEQIGSPGATRHAQMNLLGWAGLYGTDGRLETFLSDTRAEADAAATGYWSSPDRSNLGILYYRGVELLRSHKDAAKQQARTLLKMSVDSYRQLGHHDVLPVALGMLAEAERLCDDLIVAERVATEAAQLLLSGAPSLLNEGPVFLTLYKTRSDLGDLDGAQVALASSLRPLLRRLNGLVGGAYAQTFLTQLPHNAELVSALDAAGLLPDSVHRILAAAANA